MQLRRLSDDDSLDELTLMLHRAFAALGAMGLNCTCVDQPVETTRLRVGSGFCFVVETNGKITATVTLCSPDSQSPCPSYHAPDTASVRQLAVTPEHQGLGIGQQLLLFAENWACSLGFRRLVLDTPLAASHLVKFYRNCGFRAEAFQHFTGNNYLSLIMVKDLQTCCAMQTCHPFACSNGIIGAPYAGDHGSE